MYRYWQYMNSTLCTVTGSIWTVPNVKLLAVYGQYLMYIYRPYLDSILCTGTSCMWVVLYVQLPAVYGHYLK